jgi:hypothetical protein
LNFWIFPLGVRGSSWTISSRSGMYCDAIFGAWRAGSA